MTLRTVAGGREQFWTPERVTEKINRWVELYGEPPRAADWNPSAAKWTAHPWRIPRYRRGDPETGEAWPSLNAAKSAFKSEDHPSGSLNEAIRAAGHEPNKPGPRRHDGIRPEVVERASADHPELAAALASERARARDAERRAATRDRQLGRARSANAALSAALSAARRRTTAKTKTRTRTVARADRRAERRAERLGGSLRGAEAAAREARTAATRAASKLERAEATVSTLREDRRELKRELTRAEQRAERAEDRATAAGRVAPEPEVRVREVVRREVVELPGPEAREVEDARRFRREAEVRVARAEREHADLAALVTGGRRRLTDDEMDELRTRGPSGPAVLTRALGSLAEARKRGGRAEMKGALYELAAAAVKWRDAL